MPEKPEVVTVAKKLQQEILNKKITKCNIFWDKAIEYPTTEEFRKKIINQVIKNITTRGKWIVVTLSEDILLIHLRMEGKFFIKYNNEKLTKHDIVELILDDNISVRFNDTRKFGKMHLINKEDYLNKAPLNKLGYEYNDKAITSTYLKENFKNRSVPIKTVLLEQNVITGIGNIYANEILFLSKINPHKKANELTLKELDEIIKNTVLVLDKAIKKGGTTIKSFTSSEGVHGLFQQELMVHGRKKQNCYLCDTPITVKKINQRSAYYCSTCQK